MNLQTALDSLVSFIGDYGLQKLFNKIDNVQGRINHALVRFYVLTLISTITLVFIGLSLTSGLFLYICSIYGYTLPGNLQALLYTLTAAVFVVSFTIFFVSYTKIRNYNSRSNNHLLQNSYQELQELIKSFKSINEASNTSDLNKRMDRLEDAMLLIAESLKTREENNSEPPQSVEKRDLNIQRRV